MRDKKAVNTKSMVLTGMCTAVLAVMSQIYLPMPSGVPVTLQTFAVALTGCILGWKMGTTATMIYILLGAFGVPVYSELKGGLGYLLGNTGGFIFGFIFMTLSCGIAVRFKNKILAGILALMGLLICHFLGVLQFALVSDMPLLESAVLVSVPYLIKDTISIVLAFLIGAAIRKPLYAANILEYAG